MLSLCFPNKPAQETQLQQTTREEETLKQGSPESSCSEGLVHRPFNPQSIIEQDLVVLAKTDRYHGCDLEPDEETATAIVETHVSDSAYASFRDHTSAYVRPVYRDTNSVSDTQRDFSPLPINMTSAPSLTQEQFPCSLNFSIAKTQAFDQADRSPQEPIELHCSLIQNSLDNFEQLVGGRPLFQDMSEHSMDYLKGSIFKTLCSRWMNIEQMRQWLAILFHRIKGPNISLWNAILKGASSGIGTETARMLTLHGVHVILGVRNVSVDTNVNEMILKEIPLAKIDALELNPHLMASVSKIIPLNILINNTGMGMSSFMHSQDGIELSFATNNTSHFLLTNLLLENMKVTIFKSDMEKRIVNVALEAYKFSYSQGIRYNKVNEKFEFNGFATYGLEADSFMQNSLMWCKAKGCLEIVRKLFDELTENNLISWNALNGEFSSNQLPQMVQKFVDGIRSLLCDSKWDKEFIPSANYVVISTDGGLQIGGNPKKLNRLMNKLADRYKRRRIFDSGIYLLPLPPF